MRHDHSMHIRFPHSLLKRLQAEQERTGSSIAEIFRRAADDYLKRQEKDATRS